MSKRKEED